ncbi:MAG: PAS domain S-box protein, partial [Planctomycetota bacterium]
MDALKTAANILGETIQRERTEEALQKSEEQFRAIFDNALIGLYQTTPNGRILMANPALVKMLGFSSFEELSRRDLEKEGYEPQCPRSAFKTRIERQGKVIGLESAWLRSDGTMLHVRESARAVRDESGNILYYEGTVEDISERKKIRERQELATSVLKRLNQADEETSAIRDILLLIKDFTGFEAVGIRLKEGEDFPYYEAIGFPDEFVEAEKYLCAHNQAGELVRDSEGNPVLECMCGNIICGRTDPSLPFFTEGGSFWTNSTSELLASTTEQQRQARTRNRCNGEGYESVALIPLYSHEKNLVGLLQLNDKRANRFTPEIIQFFEQIGASIGIALANIELNHTIRHEKEFSENLINSSIDGILAFDRECRYTLWNAGMQRISGLGREEAVGKCAFDVFPFLKETGEDKFFLDTLAGKTSIAEDRPYTIAETGNQGFFEAYYSPICEDSGQVLGGLAIIRDITERKDTEEKLRKAHDELESRVEERAAELASANERLANEIAERKKAEEELRLDESRLDTLLKLNEMEDVPLREIANFALEEAVKLTGSKIGFMGLVNEDETRMELISWSKAAMDRCTIVDKPLEYSLNGAGIWAEAVRQHRPVIVNDYNTPDPSKKGCPEGHVELLRLMSVPIFEKEHVVALIAVGNKEQEYEESDVRQVRLLGDGVCKLAQRLQAEISLREMALFAQLNPAPMLHFDQEGLILVYNEAAGRILGETARKGASLTNVLPGLSDIDPKRCISQDLVLTREVQVQNRSYQFMIRGISGLGLGQVYGSDITERKGLEEQARKHQTELLHVSRLSTVGEMASGFAHELNQPLSAILSYANACLRMNRSGKADTDMITECLEEISSQTGRAGEVIRRIRNFIQKRQSRQSTVDVNNLVREAVGFMDSEIRHSSVCLDLGLAADMPAVLADSIQVEQVLLNLIRNAVEAMDSISTEARRLTIQTLAGSPMVEVTVSDTGHGLTAEVAERIFEPFFTTKTDGLGIGLSISRSIIEAHGGRFWVRANQPSGSTFGFALPV